jgi:hypothetical protein
MMSQFAILTRLKEPENSSLFSKMLVYDGENLKDTDPRAKSYQEYRDYAGVDEGMSGISTRFAFKIISKVFNFDSTEVAANPVHLMYVLEQQIEREQFPPRLEQKYLAFIKEHLATRYAEFIGKEIQTAYLESYSEYGQNIFDRYVTYADYWIQDHEYRDTDTGEVFDRGALNGELEKIEKPAGIANPKDFRNEIVNFVLRARANNQGKNPVWTSYEKLRAVIEKKMFSNTEELLPVISFNAKASADEAKKHEDFVTRMVAKGYTPKQVRLLCEWYLRVRKCRRGLWRLARLPALGSRVVVGPGTAMAPSDHRPRLAGKNKSIGNRERFLRRYKEQIRDAVKRAIDGRGIRDIERGEDIHIPRGHQRAGVRPWPGRRARGGAPGQPGLHVRGDRIERPKGGQGGGRRQRQGPGQRLRRGRGRLRLHAEQGRVHAGLLRGPGAAAPGAHAAGRGARVEEPARRLLQRRHAQQPARGALDARRDRPAHRAGPAPRAARAARDAGALARLKRGAGDAMAERDARGAGAKRSARCVRLGASPTSTRSTCATAAACACRCPPARR